MNMVSVNQAGFQMEIDIDLRFEEFKKMPFDQQLNEVISSDFWMSQIFGTSLDEASMKKFWHEFQKPDAEKARQVAVDGIAKVNHAELLDLLLDALDFEAARLSGDYEKDPMSGKNFAMLLGTRFAKMVTNKDPSAFRRMAQLIENKGEIDGVRGGEDSLQGQVVREFCQFFSNTRTLPTKKQIQENLGIENDDKSKKEKLRGVMIKLGLSGLPQENDHRNPPL